MNQSRPQREKKSARPKPENWVPVRVVRRSGKNRKPSTAQKAHLDSVSALKCIATVKVMVAGTIISSPCGQRACCHHVRMGYGMSMRASHWEVLPLCPLHHQNGPMGVAFHAGPQQWEKVHGTELELLHRVYDLLGLDFDKIPELRGDEQKPFNFPPWWPSEVRRRNMEAAYG